jgi:hypothetical protein
MQALYLLDYFGLYYHVLIFIIILFILRDLFIYLILIFSTHVSSCVRGGIVIRLIILDMTEEAGSGERPTP